MDQTLQARLIGATVLVALAVLLIPELLSGRKSVEPAIDEDAAARGTRSFTIELGTPDARTSAPVSSAPSAIAPASRPVATPAEESGTSGPETASVGGVEPPAVLEAPASTQPAGTAVPAPEPVPAQAAPAAAPAPQAPQAGGWVVQVGAFGSADAARRLIDELSGAGYAAHLAPVTRTGRTLYRVRVGPAGDRPAAEQMAQRIKARGLPAAVVAND